MIKPQIKTQKIIDMIENIRKNLKENNDIALNIYTYNDYVNINYTACERRAYPIDIAKKHKTKIDIFVELFNKTSFSKGKKMKKINLKDYENDDYSEYEIEISKSVQIKLGKNQSKFFDRFKNSSY